MSNPFSEVEALVDEFRLHLSHSGDLTGFTNDDLRTIYQFASHIDPDSQLSFIAGMTLKARLLGNGLDD